MSDTKLLPCPFCGGTLLDQMKLTVECLNCGARSWARSQDGTAIAAWNTRALMPEQEAAKDMREALEAVLDAYELLDAHIIARAALAKAGKP